MDDVENDRYLKVSLDLDARPPVVAAVGELDASSSGELAEGLNAALDLGAGVLLELGEVTFIDSSGLRAVTVALRRANEEDQSFAVPTMSRAVKRIFELTGLSSLLPS